ncbi:MAG: helix-turn-helix domain-containing protein [Saprospiraceae bacterium]
MPKNIDFQSFIQKYLKGLPTDFRWQQAPLQIYPLEKLSKALKVPTPLLRADYFILLVLEKGSFQQQVEIESFLIKGGNLLFVQEGESFAIQAIDESLKGYLVLFDKKVLLNFHDKLDVSGLEEMEGLIEPDEKDANWIIDLCSLLSLELESPKPNRMVGLSLFHAMLQKLLEWSGSKKSISKQAKLAKLFKKLVKAEFKSHQQVAYYAEALNVSENYLNRCVKSHFNKNCKQIIQETVILKAQIMMLETTDGFQEICYQVGLEDPSYFSRLFKKITGETPSQFKKGIMHGLS